MLDPADLAKLARPSMDDGKSEAACVEKVFQSERKLLPPEPDALIPGAPTTRYAYVGGSGGSEKEGGMCFSVPFCNFWQNFL